MDPMEPTTLKDKLLVPASRIAKVLVGIAITYAYAKWGLEVPAQYEWLRGVIEELIAAAGVAGLLGLAAHFGVAIKANPRDTASPTEAKEGRQEKAARAYDRSVAEKVEKFGAAPIPEDAPHSVGRRNDDPGTY